ncbi:HEAT repeat domain-containing protein [Methanosphaerula subterraneus]|uniref:HEAT repeat domain-containing protein n=1 Tax=Methanosphaerula subterraneus TaxID=3350244 RepID=UPI003F84004D
MSDHEEIKRQINRIRQGGLEERRAAVNELVAQGEPAVGPLIAALLAEPDPDPRWYLAGALGRIGSPGVAPLLAAMKEHSDHDFRRYAAAALGEVRGSAIRPLIGALQDPDREIRQFAALALCRIGDPAVGPLKEACAEGGDVEARARQVLWKLGEAGLAALVEDSNTPDS